MNSSDSESECDFNFCTAYDDKCATPATSTVGSSRSHNNAAVEMYGGTFSLDMDRHKVTTQRSSAFGMRSQPVMKKLKIKPKQLKWNLFGERGRIGRVKLQVLN